MESLIKMIDFLKEPSSYPHHPMEVEIKQTHASILAIAPPYVYKIKKQIDLGFLNFTTLEKRKTNCRREFYLNSRLCHEMYIAVVPISVKNGKISFGADGEVIDYALQMKRLPEGYFLHQLIKTSPITPLMIEPVLAQLTTFYKKPTLKPSIVMYGEIGQLKGNTDENIYTLQNYVDSIIHPVSLEMIEKFTNTFYKDQKLLFHKRIHENKIKNCHGDLHLEHIHMHEGKICIYDCIEFNDRFRYIDVASDIAFLAMDLDFYNRPDLSAYVVNRMTELLDDPDMKSLMDFYKCYRACVRAKVECIKYSDKEISEEERERSREKAAHYTSLPLRYAVFGSKATVIIVCGRIGSGKSTLAKVIAELAGFQYAGSDTIRKEKAALPLFERTQPEKRQWLYAEEKTNEVYQTLLNTSLTQVEHGNGIVVDATFSQPMHRTMFVEGLESLNIPYYFLEAQASDQVIKERLAKREESNAIISDARLEDFESLARAYQEIKEVPAGHLLQVNTEAAVGATLKDVFLKIAK